MSKNKNQEYQSHQEKYQKEACEYLGEIFSQIHQMQQKSIRTHSEDFKMDIFDLHKTWINLHKRLGFVALPDGLLPKVNPDWLNNKSTSML